jgi:hypothetical protein
MEVDRELLKAVRSRGILNAFLGYPDQEARLNSAVREESN